MSILIYRTKIWGLGAMQLLEQMEPKPNRPMTSIPLNCTLSQQWWLHFRFENTFGLLQHQVDLQCTNFRTWSLTSELHRTWVLWSLNKMIGHHSPLSRPMLIVLSPRHDDL